MGTLVVSMGACLFMTGVIWFVQVVHYPLFEGVGEPGFAGYAARHSRATTWVVAPVMTVELVTAGLLVWDAPTGVSAVAMWASLGLVGVTWAATGLLSVPMHTRLGVAFDREAWRRLVVTNWVRTAAWTARAGLMLAVVHGLIEG